MRREKKRSFKKSVRDKENVRPLTSLQDGETGEVSYVSGGCGLVRRLCEMGITPGAKVEVLRRCAFHGPLQIKIREVSLALGWGVASKIYLKKKNQEGSNG